MMLTCLACSTFLRALIPFLGVHGSPVYALFPEEVPTEGLYIALSFQKALCPNLYCHCIECKTLKDTDDQVHSGMCLKG